MHFNPEHCELESERERERERRGDKQTFRTVLEQAAVAAAGQN